MPHVEITRSHHPSWLLLAGVVAGVLFLSTACGTGSDSSTGGSSSADVKKAQARVDQVSKEPEFTFDTPLGKKPEQGKEVVYISVLLGIPFSQEIVGGFEDAIEASGNESRVVDANGSVKEGERLFQQAIDQGADAIVIQSIDTEALRAPVEDAKRAGIPVIALFENNPRLPTPEEEQLGVFGHVSFDYTEAGRLQSDWVIADSGGDAHAVIIQSPDSGVAKPQVQGNKSEFEKLCPDSCEYEVEDVLQADWATRIPTLTSTALKDPTVNYLMPIYDGMATYVTPEVAKAGAQDRVKVTSINADRPQMKQLADGEIIGALVGQPLDWLGWAVADQTLRAMNGAKPVANEEIPLRVFTEDNVQALDLEADQSKWFGDADYQGEYMKLWGVE
jgi:ribose transport system substrate-binding protein